MAERIHVTAKFDGGTPWGDFWEDLLKQWLELVKRYEEPKRSDEGQGENTWHDVSYWYGERPLTGLLGAAAWTLVGGWSLEEAGIDRVNKGGDRCSGRVDLWVGRGNCASSVEAKIYWAEQEDVDKLEEEVSQKLRKARKQLRKLELSGECCVGHPVSICFVVPCLRGDGSVENGKKILARLQAMAPDKCWATAKHETTNRDIEEDGIAYPGALLVARRESWRDV